MGGNENSTFSHFESEEENQPISGATSAFPGTSADSDTLDCHSPPAKKRRVFDWEGNGNKTRLNLGLGMGMGMNHWEWD